MKITAGQIHYYEEDALHDYITKRYVYLHAGCDNLSLLRISSMLLFESLHLPFVQQSAQHNAHAN